MASGEKMRQMNFKIEKTEVAAAREMIFTVLKTEGLRKKEYGNVTEEEIDKMWV